MDEELIERFYTSFNSQSSASSLLQSALNQQKASNQSKWNELLQTQSLPEEGWSDASIEAFLLKLSGLDANNFAGAIGMGEREGRIANAMVSRRHFGFAHGMGRSGNLKDPQPKAVGSSILVQLTHKLVVSALRTWGFNKTVVTALNIMPVCTGMSMMLALKAVQSAFRKVIWLRIDQKSCLKSILAAGLEVIVVEGKIINDEIVSDLDAIEAAILKEDARIHAIVSCVSCFAPRTPDSIVQISQLCQKYSIAHIVNAAYGGASKRACNLLNNAILNDGRIDAVVMSLDKNFMVPVGGALVFGPQREIIDRIASRYAGRAGMSHVIDLFITLIGLGRRGLLRVKDDRLKCFELYKQELRQVEGVQLMETTEKNDISLAIKLPKHANSSLGSQLFYRNVSGSRVVEIKRKVSVLEGMEFIDFGSHSSKWPEEFCYLNVAAAVGCSVEDIYAFIKKLKRVIK